MTHNNIDREARQMERRAWTWFAAFAGVALAAMVFICLAAGCSSTRPLDAYTRADGTKVGTSKNVVFLHGYDVNEGIAVAQDHANIAVVDSVTHKRRARAFGSAYITTVTGR